MLSNDSNKKCPDDLGTLLKKRTELEGHIRATQERVGILTEKMKTLLHPLVLSLLSGVDGGYFKIKTITEKEGVISLSIILNRAIDGEESDKLQGKIKEYGFGIERFLLSNCDYDISPEGFTFLNLCIDDSKLSCILDQEKESV